MDDLYTDSAKRVMAIAQEQANYFRHQAIGTEHLLLALTIEDKGVAGQVLKTSDGDARRCSSRNRTLGRVRQFAASVAKQLFAVFSKGQGRFGRNQETGIFDWGRQNRDRTFSVSIVER